MELSRNKSYVHTPSNEPFIGLTMHELLEIRVEEHPDREMHVFVDDNERITFAEYRRKVIDLAAGFLNLGLCRGDCIAVMGGNHMEWHLIAGAARALGLMMVPLPIGNTLDTLKQMMKKISCNALFLTRSPETLHSDVGTMIPELSTSSPGELKSSDIPTLNMVIATGANHQSGTISFDCISIPGCEEKVYKATRKVTIDDVSHMCFTSGTTGLPKLVPFSHFQALNGKMFHTSYFDSEQVNKIACVGSLAYQPAIQLSQIAPLLIGSTSVYPSPLYTYEKFVQAVQNERCNFFFLMINGIIDLAYSPINEKYDLSSLKAGISGGSFIPSAVVTHLNKTRGIKTLVGYGTTELNTICTSLKLDDTPDTYTTVGKPMNNYEVQIVNENGITVDIGEIGEIWVRSPVSFKGYYDDGEKTKETITENGWIRTGDLGKLNQEGYLTVVGRIKDIIIRHGRNIHPSEVERVLTCHQSVNKAKVVGIPDHRVGEDVCACIILHGSETVTSEDIQQYCEDKVPKNYIPKYVLMFDSFPFGLTGKVDQKKLKELAISRITIPVTPFDDNL